MRFVTPMPFFNFIKVYFGLRTLRTLKNCIGLILKLSTSLKIRIYFLRSCINLKLTPLHLDNIRKYNHLCFFETSSRKTLEKLYNKHVVAVLRLELRDTFKHLHSTRLNILKNSNNISKLLPPDIENSFFRCQERNDRYFFHRELIRIDKKIKILIQKRDHDIKSKIRPIQFFSSLHSNQDLNNSLSIGRNPLLCKITSYCNSTHTSYNAFFSNISPHIFKPVSQLHQIQDGWSISATHRSLMKSNYYCNWVATSGFL